MNPSNGQDEKSVRDAETERLRQLYDRRPTDDADYSFEGVLLSDAIKQCATSFGLITPFNEKNLKPACYKLTIGNQYALDGKVSDLTEDAGNNKIIIPPFAVAVIKTHETINMPRFLIARWNIQVSRAYQGLLWVGGPQVDAGYVGHLYCPIYNLSDQDVILKKGEPIAIIDFAGTTAFNNKDSKPYEFPPEKILFEDYTPEKLVSGLVKKAQKRMDVLEETLCQEVKQTTTSVSNVERSTERELKQLGARIDTFVLITFSVIAVLFAAVTIFVSRSEQASLWNPPLFMISLTSVFLSCWALFKAQEKKATLNNIVLGVVAFLLIVAGFCYFWETQAKPIRQQINELRMEIQELKKQPSPPPEVIGPANTERSPSTPAESNPQDLLGKKKNQPAK